LPHDEEAQGKPNDLLPCEVVEGDGVHIGRETAVVRAGRS